LLEKGKIKSAFKWQVLNISSQAILQFVFIMISARILPKEVHGAFAILNALVFVMTISSEGGVSSALIQRKIINKKHISIAFYLTVFISLFLFIIIYFSSDFISDFYDRKVKMKEIQLASLIFVIMAIGKVSEAFLIKEFRFKQLFISKNISFIIGNILVVFVLANLNFGIYSLILGFITTQLITVLLYYYFSQHSFAFNWGKKEFNDLFYFGSSFTLLRVVNYLSSQADKLLIGKYFSVTSLSIYEKGQYISKMPPKYVGNAIDAIMFSAFSKIENKKTKGEYFDIILAFVFLIGIYFGLLFYYNADLFVAVILGDNWSDAVPFLKILSLSIPAILLARIGDIIVRAENKMFKSLPIKVLFLLSIIISVLVFKDEQLIFVSALIVICYWIHGFLMYFLSMTIMKRNIIRGVLIFFLLIFIGFLIYLKFYFIELLINNNWYFLLINIIVDSIILSILLFVFKNNRFVIMFKNIFIKKIA